MQYTNDVRRSRLTNKAAGVVFRITGVHDERLARLVRKLQLSGECGALCIARRVVVVVIETAFSDCDRVSQRRAQLRQIAFCDEVGSIMWMNPRGRENEIRVVRGDFARDRRRRERFSNANDSSRARLAGACDYLVAVTGERRVREVGVAVDEDGRMPVALGHLRSIQRSTGAAT